MPTYSKEELLTLIDAYARQKALHSFLEATRVATARKDRGPARSEVSALDEANEFRAAIQTAVDALPI